MDSDKIEIPDPMLFLVAIQDLGLRYGLGPNIDESLRKKALMLMSDQAKLALALLKVPRHEQERLMDQWEEKRVNVASHRCLRDPMLNAMRDFVKGLQISIASYRQDAGNPATYHFDFEYHCDDCGGYQVTIPDNPEESSTVTCTACGRPFGTYLAVQTLCRWLGEQEMRRRKLGAYAEPGHNPGFEVTVHGRPTA